MQEVVIRKIRVDGLDARVAEFGYAGQRLALPVPATVIEHINSAANVVELGNDNIVASGRETGERPSLVRLEKQIKFASTFQKLLEVRRDECSGRIGLVATIQSDRSRKSNHSR